jgi:hypothetical protein
MDAETTKAPGLILETLPLLLGDDVIGQVALRRTTAYESTNKKTGEVTVKYNYELFLDGLAMLAASGPAVAHQVALRTWQDRKTGTTSLYLAVS